MSKLLPKKLRDPLIENFENFKKMDFDQNAVLEKYPVASFFTMDLSWNWIFVYLDPHNNQLFGLCDLGMGEPELGFVLLDELEQLQKHYGWSKEVIPDVLFIPKAPFGKYVDLANKHRRIVG